MSEKSEALRLADEFDGMTINEFYEALGDEAAAELRRLTAVEAERDALKQTLHDELAGNLRLRDLGGARPDEPMLTFLERIIAERDALLEKIKAVIAAEQSEGSGRGGFVNTPPTREHQRRVAQAWQELHAAIRAVEGEKE